MKTVWKWTVLRVAHKIWQQVRRFERRPLKLQKVEGNMSYIVYFTYETRSMAFYTEQNDFFDTRKANSPVVTPRDKESNDVQPGCSKDVEGAEPDSQGSGSACSPTQEMDNSEPLFE